MLKIRISENQGNQRLDRFLKKYLDQAALSLIYKIIRKDIKVNGKRCKEDYILNVGDEVSLFLSQEDVDKFQKPKKFIKAKKQFKIAYEDENILVAEKPFGLLTHGDKSEKKNHLANQVIDYLIEKGEYNPRVDRTFTPSPANRLDRNTTGLVIFGKTAPALQNLNHLIRQKDAISKKYLTIVAGNLNKPLRLKDKMVKEEARNLVKVVSDEDAGKVMETLVRPLEQADFDGEKVTLVEVEIITGRTHQIRVHLAKSNYPIIGDVKYGNSRINRWAFKNFKLSTQLLNAYELDFNYVGDDEPLAYLEGKVIKGTLPEDFKFIKEKIFGKEGKGRNGHEEYFRMD